MSSVGISCDYISGVMAYCAERQIIPPARAAVSLSLTIARDGGATGRGLGLGGEGVCLRSLSAGEKVSTSSSRARFRLAAKLYAQPSLWEEGEVPPPDSVLVVGLAILGLRGWSLRPGSPRIRARLDFLNSPPKEYQEDDFILEPPLHFKIREVCERPDACGFRLLRRIYADAFLYSADDLPEEFDRKTGRLVLPE